jgi:antitoxin FitA
MAQVLIRGLDDKVLKRLKRQAKNNNRSLESELRAIIESAVKFTSAEWLELSSILRSKLEDREHADSTELIREDRSR